MGEYTEIYQTMYPAVKEALREKIKDLGIGAGKPIAEISDDQLHMVAVVTLCGILGGQPFPTSFSAAYQMVWGIHNNE